jgi:uncharacterized membrane protein
MSNRGNCPDCIEQIEAQAAEIDRLRYLNDLNAVPAGALRYRLTDDERAKIVAWLHEAGYRQIADKIDAKEHLK